MAEAPRPSISEPIVIAGPAGPLEALLDVPANHDTAQVAVICHPHPQHGGAMTNKVVHILAKSFNGCAIAAVRFNFRGVGHSAGRFAEGIGETADALAVADWAAARWTRAAVSLAGFSFGGAVAIRAAGARETHRLITVAPAVDRVDVAGDRLPQCPWLLVQGEQDEVVDPAGVRRWVASLRTPPELAWLAGVDHYFHGRLNDLRNVVVDWLGGPAE